MILSKTPVRIAFGGGGTDVEPYSSDYGGMVVNATINRYFRVFLSKSGENVIKIFSNDTFTPYKFRIIDKFNDMYRGRPASVVYIAQLRFILCIERYNKNKCKQSQ